MLSTARVGGGGGRAILALLLITLAVGACGGAAGPAGQAPGLQPAAGPVEGPVGDGSGDGDAANGDGQRTALYAVGQEGLLIIKTGSLAIQVEGIDSAVSAASQLITSLGGYASGSDRSGDDESAQATVTYRVPAPRWDEALAGLRALATKVLAERSATEDVTSQVVDLGARITNLLATEHALQGIMDRATAIKDVLAVQAELTRVRGEIEQLTAQKVHLEEQAAFSTVTVTFALKPNPILTEQQGFDPASEAEQASATLVSVLQALATAGIWFAIVWLPILLALAIIGAIGLFVARRVRRTSRGPGGTAAPTPEAGA